VVFLKLGENMAGKKIGILDAILKAVAFAAKVNTEIARDHGTLPEDEQYVYVAPHFKLLDKSASLRDRVLMGVQSGKISGVFKTKAQIEALEDDWYKSREAINVFIDACKSLEEDGKLQKRWITPRGNYPGYFALKIAGATRSKSGKTTRQTGKPSVSQEDVDEMLA